MPRTFGTPAAVRALVAQRRTQALRLRAAGATWQHVADACGYSSRGAAAQDVARAIAQDTARRQAEADERAAVLAEVGPPLRQAWAALRKADPVELLAAAERPLAVLDAIAVLSRARDRADVTTS